MANVCYSTKQTNDFYGGLDVNGVALCHAFVPSFTGIVASINIWLKKHPDSANLPANVHMYLYNVDADGKPIGVYLAYATIAVPGGLDTTGQQLTGTFNTTYELVKGQNYDLVYWFDKEAGPYAIRLAGDEEDAYPC